jgi:glutamate racemase
VPRLIAERYLADLRRGGVDTAVLGCTHYPLLARTIAEVLGPKVAIVDSADAVTQSVVGMLAKHDLLRAASRAAPRHRTLCTDVPGRFQAVAERFLGRPVDAVELVDLAP